MSQEVEYRVKLDAADLSAQLQQIRSQIDGALAAQTFQTTIPSAQPTSFAYPLQQTFGNAANLAGIDTQNIINSSRNGFLDMGGLASATRLGYQRFNNDVMTAYLSQVNSPMFANADGTPIPSLYDRSTLANLATTTFGFGYDPAMPLTRGEYERRAGYAVARNSVNLASSLGFSALGTALGGMSPIPGGAFIGGFLGGAVGDLAYDTAAVTILRDFEQSSKIRDFAFNTSWRFAGGRFSREQARSIGDALAPAARSEALVGFDVTNTDVSRVIQEFTGIGGFDTVRSADEFKDRAKNVINNHRKVMEVLRLTEEDALRYMKEMQLNGYGDNFGSNAIGIAAAAYSSGYTSKEFLSFAQQASEMVRGTGISMSSAFMGGMDALVRTKSQIADGTLPEQLVRQYGGAEGYTANMVRMGYDWASSTAGYTQLAAASALGGLGNTVGLTPQETLGAAVGYLSEGGIEKMLGFQGTQFRRISGYDPQVLAAQRTLQLAKEMEMMGIPISTDTFIGYAQTAYGITAVEAQSLWAAPNGKTDIEKLRREGYQTAVDLVPSKWAMFTDRISNNFSRIINSPFAGGVARAFESTIESWLKDDKTLARDNIYIESQKNDDLRKAFGDDYGLVSKYLNNDEIYKYAGMSGTARERELNERFGKGVNGTGSFLNYEIAKHREAIRTSATAIATSKKEINDFLSGTLTRDDIDAIAGKAGFNGKDLAVHGSTFMATPDGKSIIEVKASERTAEQNRRGNALADKNGAYDTWMQNLYSGSQAMAKAGWADSRAIIGVLGMGVAGFSKTVGTIVAEGANLLGSTGLYDFRFRSRTSYIDEVRAGTIAEEAKSEVDQSLSRFANTNSQLDNITTQLRRMGANPGISAMMMQDPQLALEKMSAEATTIGLKQLNDGMKQLTTTLGSQGTSYINVKIKI